MTQDQGEITSASEKKGFLGIDPVGKKPEEIELEWFENHYRGDMPQLTFRAVVMGMMLGGVMSLSNLYVGLKTGWGLGVAITACILSFSLGRLMQQLGLLKSNLSILENNCMQSTASSAGYSTGGAMVSAISALLMIEGHHMNFWVLFAWTIFLAILGVVMAIPMKRQMINVEQLRFPSGIAAAETLRSLYATGADAAKKARALLYGALAGGIVSFFKDNEYSWFPAKLQFPGHFNIGGKLTLAGRRLQEYTVSWDNSLLLLAAGALIGIRTGWSLLLGAVINWVILAPWMYVSGDIVLNTEHVIPIKQIVDHWISFSPWLYLTDGSILSREGFLNYKQIVDWSLWIGASMMVTSGLLNFAFSWRTIGRALGGLVKIFRPHRAGGDPRLEAMEKIEVPSSWFALGILVSGLGVVYIQVVSFSINWWMGVISVLMTFFLAIVACRATGETDITPVGAMGKITQLMYGVLAPSGRVAGGAMAAAKINLMTACVTTGAAGSSADLLTDLKSGYLLGANPRKQFIAQFLGIFAGALVIVPAFYLLVPNAEALGTDKWPAPAAQVWRGVAELLSKGLSVLADSKRWGLAIGGLIGIALVLIERAVKPAYRKFVPSAMGIGLAFVIQFYYSFSMFIGALIVWILTKKAAQWSEKFTIPIASGVIAGESLMGVFLQLTSLEYREIWEAVKASVGLGGE